MTQTPDATRNKKSARPPVSAKAVVFFGKKFLLLRQPNGHWDLPGGKIDSGETVETALTREVREETNLKIGPLRFLTSSLKRSRRDSLLILSFLCQPKKSPPGKTAAKKKSAGKDGGKIKSAKGRIRLSREHKGFRLVDFAEAKRLKLRKPQIEAIRAAEDHLAQA